MKIYAIETVLDELRVEEEIDKENEKVKEEIDQEVLEDNSQDIQDYDEWEDYVTQYKPDMVPHTYKGMTSEEYLAYRDKINDYCKFNFGPDTIERVMDLYRKLTPIKYIGDKLGIKPVYISALLKMYMPREEFSDIKAQIKHIMAVQYTSRGYKDKVRMDMEKKLPLLVWQAYYVEKKSFEQIARDLKITYERLERILNAIRVSFAPQVSQF